jgi:hypothetical protein
VVRERVLAHQYVHGCPVRQAKSANLIGVAPPPVESGDEGELRDRGVYASVRFDDRWVASLHRRVIAR